MSESQMPSADSIDALMKDPAKKQLLLQLLLQNKDSIEQYKRQELLANKSKTPLKKVKRIHCESPTALQRRRALEKLHQKNTSDDSSEQSESSSVEPEGPKLPFEQLLKGVTAYVEVKRDNVNKSEGVKSVMRLMGAKVQDQFTNNVTHVVFKDGSFATYQKAKLMKVHLVSVLWLDAVRRTCTRVSEKKFPAFGNYDHDDNASILCSQLQKDYEEIVKEEKRRKSTLQTSIVELTQKNKRHTIAHTSTQLTPKKALFTVEDEEVESILNNEKCDLTSDDSDCDIMIDGHVTNKRSKISSPAITDDLSKTSNKTSSLITDDLSFKENGKVNSFSESSESTSLLRVTSKNRKRQTVNIITDMVITPNIDTKNNDRINKRTSSGSDRTKSGLENGLQVSNTRKSSSINGDDEIIKKVLKDLNNQSHRWTSSGSDRTKSGLGLEVSNTKKNNSIQTTMSSLRLSDSNEKNKKSVSTNSSRSKISEGSRSENFLRLSGSENELSSLDESKTKMTPARTRKSTRIVPKNDDSSVYNQEISQNQSKNSNSSLSSASKISEKSKSKTPRTRKSSRIVPTNDNSATKEQSGSENSTLSRSSKISESSKRSSKSSLRSSCSENDLFESDESETTKSTKIKKKSKEENVTQRKPSPKNRRRSKSTSRSEETNKSKSSNDASPSKKPRTEKKTRKLYNPDDITVLSPAQSDTERAEILEKKSQKSKTQDVNEDLLNLLTRKIESDNTRTRRLSQRVTQTKPKYVFTSSSSESPSVDSVFLSPIKRRSTLDFQSVSQSSQQKRKLNPTKRNSSIVCTKMHRPEVLNFQKIVKNLGGFFVEDQVSDMTTHLVAGEWKRTINMLRAMARGCWILKHEWLLKSEQEGKWLEEEDYEVTEFSPAVQQCRLQRQAFGPKYRIDVFKNCGFIYVAKTTTPKQKDLQELITTCQGRTTTIYRNAAIVVGELIKNEDLTCVKETWVLDSITFNKLKPFKNYLIKPEQGAASPTF